MPTDIRSDVAVVSRITAVNLILKTLCDITSLRFSLVARVTEESWTACAIYDNMDFGLKPGDELVLKTTYCNTVREKDAPLLVKHASMEDEFKDHPALKTYAVESYLGVPLFRQTGEYFGVLCALDTLPSNLSANNLSVFTLMADLISYELEAEEQRLEMAEALKLANQTTESRARFMGILGHDLRTPLNTMVGALSLLKNGTLDADKNEILLGKLLKTTNRMKFLIEDLLDAAQTAQDNRILVQKQPADLRDICEQVIEEFRLAHPHRQIIFSAEGACLGEWDTGRLGQVTSNLVSNALSYGNPDHPVTVELNCESEQVLLRVNNKGETMMKEVRQNLFTAFWRGSKKIGADGYSRGLGLGLYIVKQIVETHGGTIGIESDDNNGTTFSISLRRFGQPTN